VINLLFMGAAYAAASLVPFELLLAAYAFLGPAHYLTEISWLHDRRYFCGQGLWLLLPLGLATGVVVFYPAYWSLYIWGVLGLAAAMIVGRTTVAKIGAAALLFAGYFFFYVPGARASILLVALLPTMIHVFVFTWLFMLQGYLRRPDPSALAGVVLMPLAALSFALAPFGSFTIAPDWVSENIGLFNGIATDMGRVLGLRSDDAQISALMKIISFAYTYHYLNWFAKTGIIGWYRMSQQRGIALAALYLVFIGIYAADYRTGFQALLFLSVLHVALELPLDLVTIRALAARLVPRPASLFSSWRLGKASISGR
jgi:hypothetical protein